MNVEEAVQIHACAELSVGDEIEAWHNGRLFHRGRVSQTIASLDLFWMVDSRTGARRLLDVGTLVILRSAVTVPADPRGVLFHAPDLRDAGRTGVGW